MTRDPDVKPAQARRPAGDLEPSLEGSIVDCFGRVVESHAKRVAAVAGPHSISYGELDRRANQVARLVLDTLAEGEECVSLMIPHSLSILGALLGVLKAGRPYTALDPYQSEQGMTRSLTDSGSRLLLADPTLLSRARRVAPPGARVLDVSACSGFGNTAPRSPPAPDRAAVILYTSGSTGAPRGVVHEHRSVIHAAKKTIMGFGITPEDNLGLLTPCSYGASMSTLFGALLSGAKVCLIHPREHDAKALAGWIRDERITIYHSVPTLLRRVVGYSDQPPKKGRHFDTIRVVRLGGEAIARRDIEAFVEHFPDSAVLCVNYGASEVSSICGWFFDKSQDIPDEPFPVGSPHPGTDILIVDDDLRPLSSGSVGEVVVGGPGVARGYHGKPEETEAHFLPPGACMPSRCFRTGDLGRRSSCGSLTLLGRKDSMLKVRGVRVDPLGMEAVLRSVPRVAEAAIVPRTDARDEVALIAYFVAAPGAPPTIDALRRSLRHSVPDEVQPSTFVQLESLPLLPNGKVDRVALSSRTPDDPTDSRNRPPNSAAESRMLDLWRALLNTPSIGLHDDFFELGGSSIVAARLFLEIATEFGLDLPLSTLFAAPTVAALTAVVCGEQPAQEWKFLVPIRRTGDRTPLVVVHGVLGNAIVFRPLTDALGDQQPVYGVQSPGLDGHAIAARRLEEVAADYVIELRELQPNGPYRLAGFSVGGWFAYEMAHQLITAGEKVEHVFLFDTQFPSSRLHKLWRRFPRPRALVGRALNRLEIRLCLATGRPVPHRIRAQHVSDSLGRLTRAYSPPRCQVPVTLMLAAENKVGSTTNQTEERWQEVIDGRLDVVEIPGKHEGVTKPDTVLGWAEELARRLA